MQDRSPSIEHVALTDVARAIRNSRWLILAASLIGATAFWVWAWRSVPIYRSEAVVRIAEDPAGGARGVMDNELGRIASLAGLDVGGTQDRKAEYLALLKSKTLIKEFIESKDLLPVLFEQAWDSQLKAWREEQPPMEDAVDKFRRDILRVTEDRYTGLITVRVEWREPDAAAAWINELIDRVNDKARQTAIEEAQSSIDFLNDELSRNPALEIREGIYRLVEAHLGRVVIANAQRQYALKIIDPPTIADVRRYVRPRIALESAVGGAFGCMAGILVGLWRKRRDWLPDPRR